MFWLVLTIFLPEFALANNKAFEHQEYNRDAFARPIPTLTASQLRVFNFGNRLFNTNWVIAPASAVGFDGLGPTFNRVSCSGCHTRDGRGRPPIDGESEFNSMLLRWSIPGAGPHGAPKPVPGYGEQLNDRAIPGVPREAKLAVRWKTRSGKFNDGSPFELREPIWMLSEPAFGALPKDVLLSARVAPALVGIGLLEAVSDATLNALADPDDRDQDGISGRVNRVWSLAEQKLRIGRFGWKAGVPSLLEQNAQAATGDIGITTPLTPTENCPEPQTACAKAVNGGQPEMSPVFLDKLTQYTQMLGVPSARTLSQTGENGRQHFQDFGCAGCHRMTLKTGESAFAFLHQQEFAPYTDLLLHDMGPGLADNRPEFDATGREWRTPPLWGLGLIETVNGHTFLLHDGRARNLSEAILWHDGEARKAKENFLKATANEREALLEFLRSL